MGLLSGSRPDGLGFNAGKFKPCSWKPNCVSSTTDPKEDAGHHIEPLAFSDALIGYAPAGLIGHGPIAAVARYDVLWLGAFALAFLGAHLLARELEAQRRQARRANMTSGMTRQNIPWLA